MAAASPYPQSFKEFLVVNASLTVLLEGGKQLINIGIRQIQAELTDSSPHLIFRQRPGPILVQPTEQPAEGIKSDTVLKLALEQVTNYEFMLYLSVC